jgi:uncharacterized SAM-binding protein YcdF (DUF218 family)
MTRLRPSTRRGWVLLAVATAAAILIAASGRLFVWPPSDAPGRTDAVVALGGDPGQRRAAAALQLAVAWHVPIAVISLGGGPARCPQAPKGVQVICFRPNPVNTRGEAEYASRLAESRHWHRIMVVPQRTQTTRARMLFERCTDIQLQMVPVSDRTSHLPVDVLYEWGALLKALVWQRAC